MSKPSVLEQIMDKTQGTVARTLDLMPSRVQERVAKLLGYQHHFAVNPFLKCLCAMQQLLGENNLIAQDYAKSRIQFQQQMRSIRATPTPVALVEMLQLPLKRATIQARRYHPQPNKKLPMIIFIMVEDL